MVYVQRRVGRFMRGHKGAKPTITEIECGIAIWSNFNAKSWEVKLTCVFDDESTERVHQIEFTRGRCTGGGGQWNEHDTRRLPALVRPSTTPVVLWNLVHKEGSNEGTRKHRTW